MLGQLLGNQNFPAGYFAKNIQLLPVIEPKVEKTLDLLAVASAGCDVPPEEKKPLAWR